jgi:NACalpha-BTF3-like transcription factor
MNSQAQLSAAQQLASGNAAPSLEQAGDEAEDDDDIPELEAPEDDGPVDESGVDPKDIDLVMQQVNCTRAKAVRVLKESGGDLINASELKHLLHTSCNTHIISPQLWQRASRLSCSPNTSRFTLF